ncbi:MAG: peptidyl-prolyl cis-trans isomerase [Vicinamibacterales bacterium]
MTMLDRMRRHKNWLKWSLFIVVIAFILLYIPSFMRTPGMPLGTQDVVASVEGRDITVGRFRRAYQQQIQQYRNQFGGNMDERLLRQLGIDQRIVQQMIEEEAALVEAQKLGIRASDQEVQERIKTLPYFQENGQFIGETRYRQMLQAANPPLRTDEFEDQVRRSIIVEKLQAALTDWIAVTDTEVDGEFKRRNEKVKLSVVSFPADKYRESATASDAEIAAEFDANKNNYRIPEKRKVKYAALDTQAIRERIQVTAQDIQRHYEDNQQQYRTPEQVRASHILFKTEGKDDAAVRKQAEDVLAQVKAPGADFAKLANQYTEEEIGKTRGGDLDFFERGRMAKEFEDAAFALPPGQISGVVKSPFGYHIIKVTDRKPASKRSLEEVRAQIEDQIKWERAQNEAQRIVDDVAPLLKKPADVDTVSKSRGLTVGESNFFAREEPISGIGLAPAVSQRAFEMKEGEVSEAVRTPQGFAFITLTGTEAARVPSLDEVKAKVREDVVKKKAIEAARQNAAAQAPKLKAGDFAAAAKAAGLTAESTELLARGAAIPQAGISPAVDAAAFSLPVGGVSDPITTDNGAVVIKVLEKKDVTPDELSAGKQQLRDQLRSERKNRFYSAYMSKARERMKININREALAQVIT